MLPSQADHDMPCAWRGAEKRKKKLKIKKGFEIKSDDGDKSRVKWNDTHDIDMHGFCLHVAYNKPQGSNCFESCVCYWALNSSQTSSSHMPIILGF